MDADTHVGIRFADDAASQRSKIMTDFNKQNHKRIEPSRIRRQQIINSLDDPVG
jgi:hypothetical protein